MSKSVGKSVTRVDAYEKATGRAKYVADLCDQSALVARILHATIAHGYVKSIDTTEAEAVPGVVKVLTCFNVPDYRFPTAGHPWSTDPAHQDVADRAAAEPSRAVLRRRHRRRHRGERDSCRSGRPGAEGGV